MSIRSERVKRWRVRTKQRLVEAFEGKCGICGYDRCEDVFEFHHVDSSTKDFGLGAVRGNIISWDRIVAEVRKCVMLCSNCHKELHSSRSNTTLPENITRFNEEYAFYKTEKEELLNPCPICNKLKPVAHKTCSSKCAGRMNRKVDWDAVDVVELVNQYQNYEAIGDLLGVTGAAVSRRYKQVIKNNSLVL